MHQPQEQSVFITRQQYDSMIGLDPEWMQHKWPLLQRMWQINGCRVRVPDQFVNQLLDLCVGCGFNPGLVRLEAMSR